MTILHVDSSISGAISISRALSQNVVARLTEADPSIPVIRRDLAASPLPHFAMSDYADHTYADEFLSAGTIVIGAPMYNFGIPSNLKAWLDRLTIPGKTFRYGASGVEGLAGGRRVIIASSRGGIFSQGSAFAPFDHQETYLKAFFGFLGIEDVTFIRAEGLSMGDEVRTRALELAEAEIYKLVA